MTLKDFHADKLYFVRCDPESSRLREMAQNEYDLIEDFDDTMFGQASVYVRRSSAT